jgi:hypothetical protein
MKVALIICATIIFASTAGARIGETEEQCVKRYGEPVERLREDKTPGDVVVFKTGAFQIKAYFISGKAECLLISKIDRGKFSNEELSILLGSNSGNATWMPERGIDQIQEYSRSDRRARAIVAAGDTLMIESSTFIAARNGMSNF